MEEQKIFLNLVRPVVLVTIMVFMIIRLWEERKQKFTPKIFFYPKKGFSLDDSHLASTSVLSKFYDIFGFEPLLSLNLGISKLRKEFTLTFFGSDIVIKNPGGVVEHRQPPTQMRLSILRGVNSMLAGIDLKDGMPGVNVNCNDKSCVPFD